MLFIWTIGVVVITSALQGIAICNIAAGRKFDPCIVHIEELCKPFRVLFPSANILGILFLSSFFFFCRCYLAACRSDNSAGAITGRLYLIADDSCLHSLAYL